MRVVLLAVALAVIAAALTSHASNLPVLPNELSISVEINNLQDGYSVEIQQTLDITGKRLRFRRQLPSRTLYGIVDYNALNNYSWDPFIPSCNRTDLDPNGFNPFNNDGKPVTPAELFGFGGDEVETYLGTGEARGILCDVWMGTFNRTRRNPPRFHLTQQLVNITYYWSVPEWKFAGNPAGQVPIEAHISGYEKDLETGETKPVEQVISFSNYSPGPQPADEYIPPDYCFANCLTGCSGHGRCNMGTCQCDAGWWGDMCQNVFHRLALELGLGLGFAALAIIVTVIVCLCMRRRELRKYKSLESTDSEMGTVRNAGRQLTEVEMGDDAPTASNRL